MASQFALPQKIIVFAVVVPLAALIGFLLATPDQFNSVAGVGIVFFVLLLPLLLRWHYPFLVFAWNAAVTVFFLPGQPALWMMMGVMSFGLSVAANILNPKIKLVNVPALTWVMVLFGLVVLGTAYLTGGIGMRSMGGSRYGGKRYFHILFAIFGYFALSCQAVPPAKRRQYVGLFLLSGATLAMGNLIYYAGEHFYWLYLVFSVDHVMHQAAEDFSTTSAAYKFSRLSGISWAGLMCFCWMLARYGLMGVLDRRRPWRMVLAATIFALSLLGGFRSIVVIFPMLVLAHFFAEGLHRTRVMPVALLGAAVALVMVYMASSRLPLSMQRSLSILPMIDLHPAAVADAEASTDWRLRMWSVVLPEIPKYLLLGKGYTTTAVDHWLAVESFRRGITDDFEPSLVAGDYHNGPLSVLLPFGLWGALAFVAFVVAGLKVLYANYRYGPPDLKTVNTFFLCYFIVRLTFFLFVFGGISSDVWIFMGLLGMSVGLNGGLCRSAVVEPRAAGESRAAPMALPAYSRSS